VPIDDSLAEAVRRTAAQVFSTPAPVHHLATKLLDVLRQQGTTVLLTKGDPAVQRRRIEQAQLADAFDEIRVVSQKDEASFRELLSRYDTAPDRGISIGNSLPSDINPALRVGMKAIWVDAHVWEYERRETIPVTAEGPDRLLWTAPSLEAVPGIVAAIVGGQT
jgi:putative hydrolase of the HAD superfamily